MTGIIISETKINPLREMGNSCISLQKACEKRFLEYQIEALRETGALKIAIITDEKNEELKKAAESSAVEYIFTKNKPPLSFFSNFAEEDEAIIIFENHFISKEEIIKLKEKHEILASSATVLLKQAENGDDEVYSLSEINKVEGVFMPPSFELSYSDLTFGGALIINTSECAKNNAKTVTELIFPAIKRGNVFGILPEKESVKINSVSTLLKALKELKKPDNEGNIIEKSVKIGKNTKIINSVIKEGAVIGENCFIKDALIFNKATVANNCEIKEFSAVGIGAEIGEDTVLKSGVIIPNFHSIGNDANNFYLSGEEAYKAGKSSGSSSNTVIVGSFGEEEEKNAAALFANGAASAGALVLMANNLPESLWRFAMNKFGGESGAFFGLNKTVIKENNKLRKSPKAQKSGEKQELNGIFNLYAEELKKYAEHRLAAVIKCEEHRLEKIYKENLTEGKEEDYISFFVSENGGSFSFSDEKGVYFSEDKAKSIAVYAALVADGKVSLPENEPFPDRLYEKATGGKIIRNGKESLIFDAGFCISRIAKALKITNKPLFELAKSAPEYYLKTVTVSNDEARKIAMRHYSSEFGIHPKNAQSFQTEHGSIFLKTENRKIKMTVCGENEDAVNAVISDFLTKKEIR